MVILFSYRTCNQHFLIAKLDLNLWLFDKALVMSVGNMPSNTFYFEFYFENHNYKSVWSEAVAHPDDYFNLSDLSRGTTGSRLNDRLIKYNSNGIQFPSVT